MPLREDLLEPIPGDSPAGPNLQYDKAFDQIKEARIEDDDSIPTGNWGRALKKADRPLVIKLAGETLAKRSKDLRLAGWYAESLMRREGFGLLPLSIDLLYKLQDSFWDTVHPQREDDGDIGLRIGSIEGAASLLAVQLKLMPLTRGGVNYLQYQDARALGYEKDATTKEKKDAREDALKFGRLAGEDLDKSLESTPKAFYAETEKALMTSMEAIDELDRFHEEKYGDDYPSLVRLKATIEDVKKVVSAVLIEKRKTDPDPEPVAEAVPETPEPEIDPFARFDQAASSSPVAPAPVAVVAPVTVDIPPPPAPVNAPPATAVSVTPVAAPAPGAIGSNGSIGSIGSIGFTSAREAIAQVAAAAEFLRKENPASCVPYLLGAALSLGETRDADFANMNSAPAPATETRQALRRLANEGKWDELLQLALSTLAEPCGRAWLDLQRYLWRAATAQNYHTVASAVVSTVRGLLLDRPMLREGTLDDDTPAANAETQGWIDAEVLPPAPAPEPASETAESATEPAYLPPPAAAAPSGPPDVYETALALLKKGHANEAITLVVRDSEQQPSGRMRFQRRVQMAQLCLAADHAAVAYPVLVDLSAEIERRALESWEAAELLAQPLSLLLRCLDQRKGSSEDREVIFSRLCRLDPQAALSVRR